MKVLVIGAGGNLGRRLVERALAHGHQVTAFLRDPSRFALEHPRLAETVDRVAVGDVLDPGALGEAMAGQDVALNAAGNVTDGEQFARTFRAVADAAQAGRLPRLWMVAGAAILTIPHADRLGVSLPGVPPIYRIHERNWRYLEGLEIDWSLMCPGPMVPAGDGTLRDDLGSRSMRFLLRSEHGRGGRPRSPCRRCSRQRAPS